MRCPTLKELPPPPVGKTGWPWTEESQQLPERMPDDSPWPKITIVTPSLNQGQFIEETIRSVLLQGYPDLEYILMDGGSTDHTLSIIKKYHKWFAYWESKADRGQAHGINKGFRKSTGDIIAWINSDDFYLHEALCKAACWLSRAEGVPFIYGDCKVVDQEGQGVDYFRGTFYPDQDFRAYWNHYVPQPSVFFLRNILDEVGYLDEALTFVLDYDYWVRCSRKHLLYYTGEILATFRLHNRSKTIAFQDKFDPELDRAVRKHWGKRLSLSYFHYLHKRHRHRSGLFRWYAYEALQNGDLRQCTSFVCRATLQDPFFFLSRKFLNLQNLKNRYVPFLRQLLLHTAKGKVSSFPHRKKDVKLE